MESLKKLVALADEAHDAEAAWLRQILTLATGALALLVGLGPESPTDTASRLLLAGTWVSLGLGIVFGAAATYLVVERAMKATLAVSKKARIEAEGGIPPTMVSVPINSLYIYCKPVMIISLLVAVVCLTGFSVLSTFTPMEACPP